eukprot:NODE_8323_length_363_cov_25.713376_g6581_i0.p4 GENE.NODE_8323_length_363_cov_25.713376_g6581_i0~~NODE_8323_length_363_cov_25.713376_g6581_i0.p4  ORF type:complete len:50 (+),score=33.35 NODE_8323_length_363_cov_25.713376_g6581_i0:22-150(+)
MGMQKQLKQVEHDFAAMDVNQDSVVDVQEFQALLKRLGEVAA